MWGDYESSEWFSSFLGVQCWLARHEGSSTNGTSEQPSQRDPMIAFANDEPLLLLSERAVSVLNGVLLSQNQSLVSARHFRPNLVVRSEQTSPNANVTNPEDQWSLLKISQKNVHLEVVGQCARCSMVDFDPTSGMKGKTLRAMADYRRRGGQITFGIFLRGEPNPIDGFSQEELWLEEGDIFDCY